METRYCTECCSLCVPYGKSSDGRQIYYRCTNPGCGAEDTDLIVKSSPWDISHAWRCKECGALHMTTHQEYLGYKIPCRRCGAYYDPERQPPPGKFGIDYRSMKHSPLETTPGSQKTPVKGRGSARPWWMWVVIILLALAVMLVVMVWQGGGLF